MLSIENMEVAWKQLEQALYNHDLWHKGLIRTLTCRLPCDQRDIAEDAHSQCRFGQWYYGNDPQMLHDNASFISMEYEHKHMHQLAAQLLRESANGAPISPDDYDNFANSLERLRLQINTLMHELENSLYSHDPLTGSENRVSMLKNLREIHELVKRSAQQCCISIMDLDHFKAINDTYGHLIGDQVLIALVRQVKENMRPYDKIFRYGGEEFLMSLPNTDLQGGHAVIERIREGLVKKALAYDSLQPIFATASFGITLLDPDVSVEESIDRADKAMYAAKAAGRNCARIWDSSLTFHPTSRPAPDTQRT